MKARGFTANLRAYIGRKKDSALARAPGGVAGVGVGAGAGTGTSKVMVSPPLPLVVVLAFVFVLVLAVSAPVPAQARAQTLDLLSLFDIDMGARPMGMGGAFTGVADDENAPFYNPAGLGFLTGGRFGSFYEARFGGAGLGGLALTWGNLGGAILFYSLGGITQYSEQDEPVGTFGYGSYAAVSSFGVRPRELALFPGITGGLPPGLALGFNLKFYTVSTLKEGSGSGLTTDSGLLLDLGGLTLGGLALDRLRLGVMIENLLSTGVKYGSGHVERWGIGLRLGASAALLEERLIIATDLESTGAFHLGTEYRLGEEAIHIAGGELALRGGALLGRVLSASVGLGMKVRSFRVDYCLIFYPQLPSSHRLSLTIEF